MENQLIDSAEANRERNQTRLSETAVNSCEGLDTGWEVVTGAIVGVIGSAKALVRIARAALSVDIAARTVVSLSEKDVGKQVVLAFENGDLAKPVILGVIKTAENDGRKLSVVADGDKFVVAAEREIELRCGEASITLTRAGKVLIKGEYVLTRAKGLNRIKGAAVSIN
jgi:Domain of unknown function (DUF6484)